MIQDPFAQKLIMTHFLLCFFLILPSILLMGLIIEPVFVSVMKALFCSFSVLLPFHILIHLWFTL